MNFLRQIILNFVVILFAGCGSYFFAERYTIYCCKKDFVHKVDSLKIVHPEYKWLAQKSDGTWKESGGVRTPYDISFGDTTLLHYDLDFHVPSESLVFSCHIVPYDSLCLDSVFDMSLSAVAKDTDRYTWYSINTKELSKESNKKYKRLFEREILDKLNVQWEKTSERYFNPLKRAMSREPYPRID